MSSSSPSPSPQQANEILTIEPPESPTTLKHGIKSKLLQLYCDYEFFLILLMTVPLAKVYPILGSTYLKPEITSSWIAIMYIFLISGVSLKFDEFKNVFTSLRFHSLVQTFNFLIISAISYGFSRILKSTNAVSSPLCDGVVISGCLPIAINMAIIVTKMCNGDTAMAVFQSALGNMIGVFVSPLLILGYLGVSGNTNLGKIFYELLIKVVLPLIVGQILQCVSKSFADFAVKYQKQLSKSQMFALIYVLYTVFCNSFSSGSQLTICDFLLVLFSQLLLLCFALLVSWYLMKACYPKKPKLQIAGFLACSFKTVGLGVPIVYAIYKNSPDVSLYLLPAIMWHVLQLMIGSILAPRLRIYAASEDIPDEAKNIAPPDVQNLTSTEGGSVPSESSEDGLDEEAQILDTQTN